MARYVRCDECGIFEHEARAAHEHGHLPNGWLLFEIHRSIQGTRPWLQLINGGELCSLACALKRVERMKVEGDVAASNASCSCPDEDTRVATCVKHGALVRHTMGAAASDLPGCRNV